MCHSMCTAHFWWTAPSAVLRASRSHPGTPVSQDVARMREATHAGAAQNLGVRQRN